MPRLTIRWHGGLESRHPHQAGAGGCKTDLFRKEPCSGEDVGCGRCHSGVRRKAARNRSYECQSSGDVINFMVISCKK